jgi:hypothetical protein
VPSFNLWGRFASGRIIVPGFDRVFVTPLTVIALATAGGVVVRHAGEWYPVVTACIVALLWFALLSGGPTMRAWVLTGQHRYRSPARLATNKQLLRPIWIQSLNQFICGARIARHRMPVHVLGGREERPLELGDLRRFVAGADVFSRQSDGTTIAGQYAREGITLRPASMERINGWAAVLQGFGDSEGGFRPKLFIHRRCARLVETLPALQHDPSRPEDVLKVDADEEGVGGDDAADALRYLVATRSRTISQRELSGL